MATILTVAQYLAPHEPAYGHLLSVDDRTRAERTVRIINGLIARAEAKGCRFELHPKRGDILTSGWRPGPYNATIPNAAPRSRHITLEAADLYDPEGEIDEWCYERRHQDLAELGLWMEAPACTKGWCHLQVVPPKSGKRAFCP